MCCCKDGHAPPHPWQIARPPPLPQQRFVLDRLSLPLPPLIHTPNYTMSSRVHREEWEGGRRPCATDRWPTVQGSGCRVNGSGFRVQGSGCKVQGAGFRVQGSGFRVQGSGGDRARLLEVGHLRERRRVVHLRETTGYEPRIETTGCEPLRETRGYESSRKTTSYEPLRETTVYEPLSDSGSFGALIEFIRGPNEIHSGP